MKFRSITFTLLSVASLALLTEGLAGAAAIQVNSTCYVGDCSTNGLQNSALGLGTSISVTPFSFAVTLANRDQFNISGTYSAAYSAANGTFFQASATATYLGNAVANGPSQADVLTLDVLQDFQNFGPGTWNGTYTENAPVGIAGNIGAGSFITTNVFYNGQGVGQLGPFIGPGNFLGQTSANLTGLTGNYLAADFQFTYNFQPGSAIGSGGSVSSSTVPEPASTLPMALVLMAGIVCAKMAKYKGGIHGSRS